MSIIIKQDFLPKNHPSRSGRPLNNPKSITIHWNGPFPRQTPDIVRNWFLRGSDGKGVTASYHFCIKDESVSQFIPEQEVAWHAGSAANFNSLGVCVIPMNADGEFSADSIDTLIWLLKRLPRVEIVRHYEHTQKDCPRWYTPHVSGGAERWDELLKELYEGRDEGI